MSVPFPVGSTSNGANNGNNLVLTTGGNPLDYIVVSATRGTSRTGSMTVTTSSGGSYTNLIGATIQSSSCQFSVWGMVVSSAGAPTQAIIAGTGNSSDSVCGVASVWRFVRSPNPLDAAVASTTGNSSNPDSPATTLLAPDVDELVITAIGQQATGVTLTPPTTYALIASVSVNDNWDSAGAQAYAQWNSTVAIVDPGPWTSTLSAGWCSATIVLASFDPIPSDYSTTSGDFYRVTDIIGY